VEGPYFVDAFELAGALLPILPTTVGTRPFWKIENWSLKIRPPLNCHLQIFNIQFSIALQKWAFAAARRPCLNYA